MKKQRTRDALIRAAHELFVSQGYDATTVDQIAAAVQVSQRTFFRYFSNKEEVALAPQQLMLAHFLDVFRGRPSDEAPLESLRGALDEAWADLESTIEAILPIELHMRMWELTQNTPALLGAALLQSQANQDLLTEELARRCGLDPEGDPRPRVLVAAFVGVTDAAVRAWAHLGHESSAAARRITMSHLDQLQPALCGSWDCQDGRPEDVSTRSPC
ncbi:TetR family transcriptional regulator [Streptomyces boncukensis]|nr:TetR family transcriptional regulator [Streptomyces boncukensis]